jgi:hypothetical protein
LNLSIGAVQQTPTAIVDVGLGHLTDSHPWHARNIGADAFAAVMISVLVVEMAVFVAPLVYCYCYESGDALDLTTYSYDTMSPFFF